MKNIQFLKYMSFIFLFSCGNGEDHTGITLKYANLSDHEVSFRVFNYNDEQISRVIDDTTFYIFEDAKALWNITSDGKVEKLNDYLFLNWVCDSVYIDFDNSKRLIFRSRVDNSGRSIFNEENYETTSRTYKSGVFHTLLYTITNEDFEQAVLIE